MDLDFFVRQFLLILVSFVANFLSAMAGGGAGLLQLPALILLGLPFPVALATHKVASVALGLGATTRHNKERNINFKFALYILFSGLPGVFLGSSVVLNLPDKFLTILLGIFTLSLSIYSSLDRNFGIKRVEKKQSLYHFFFGAIGLFLIGFLNGSITSGTGLFVTIWLVRWYGLDYSRAVAYTLILVGLFWNATGALVLGTKGKIAWSWLPILFLGSISGGYLGAHMAIVRSKTVIKRCFEFLALVMGASMILKSFSF